VGEQLHARDYASARQTAAAFLRALQMDPPRTPEAAAAHRVLGLTYLHQGNFVEAQYHLMTALDICDPKASLNNFEQFISQSNPFCLLTLKRKLQLADPGHILGKACAPHARAPHDSQLL
jgi:hypothetical protein